MMGRCGICESLSGPKRQTPIFENELWHVRHMDAPYGVAGWMMLISKRHVAGPAHLDDREAANFGVALRHFEHTLEQVTGALRIYTAALGESHPHLHCHMVPRYAHNEAKGWALFDEQRRAAAGEITVDPTEVTRISERFRAALEAAPPPVD